MYPIQCPHCHARYDVNTDSWNAFPEHIEVALHTLCPSCLRAYVTKLEEIKLSTPQ